MGLGWLPNILFLDSFMEPFLLLHTDQYGYSGLSLHAVSRDCYPDLAARVHRYSAPPAAVPAALSTLPAAEQRRLRGAALRGVSAGLSATAEPAGAGKRPALFGRVSCLPAVRAA